MKTIYINANQTLKILIFDVKSCFIKKGQNGTFALYYSFLFVFGEVRNLY